jgi:hypothetical protein
MRFNPFSKVNCRYGAPMGRHGHSADMWDGEGKLYARHCGGDGYYDRGGAYWGHSAVYAVWTRGGDFCAYVDARSKEQAIANVRAAVAS